MTDPTVTADRPTAPLTQAQVRTVQQAVAYLALQGCVAPTDPDTDGWRGMYEHLCDLERAVRAMEVLPAHLRQWTPDAAFF